MANVKVQIDGIDEFIEVPSGILLSEALTSAGIDVNQPCGGQGRCGRCLVKVEEGKIRRRSSLKLTAEDIEEGYALSCQTVVEGDVKVSIPDQNEIKRTIASDLKAVKVTLPDGYDPKISQSVKVIDLIIPAPTMDDQIDDWNRLKQALKQQAGYSNVSANLDFIRHLSVVLRQSNWNVSVVADFNEAEDALELILIRKSGANSNVYGISVDIGTTTVSVWLVDLLTGEVVSQAVEYNQQIKRGEDVISRIIYSSKSDENSKEMSNLVIGTINELIDRICSRANIDRSEIVKGIIAGNTTMMHLLLEIPTSSIRMSPFIPVINQPPKMKANELNLDINPLAVIDCLPGVASYVGADITAGVFSSGLYKSEKTILFIDVGTNGEIALGSKDWLITCACSAGPAFEGAGVQHGMRATEGAIEEVWINPENFEPDSRVIGDTKPIGICGSGLISIIAEMFTTGVLDKSGNIKLDVKSDRIRKGDHGAEYVISWGKETKSGEDIFITKVDIENLIRAKAAIYAGFSVLADNVGFPLEMVEEIHIGGSFGKYIDVEKAIQIGLMPDMDWENFKFLGNTSVKGAYCALISKDIRNEIDTIASKMTYIELSADNSFFEAFTSALFLPHTDLAKFPNVKQIDIKQDN